MQEDIVFNSPSYYDKDNYNKLIDTSFKQLGVKSIEEQIAQQPNVNDFFNMYNNLFYSIPELGVSDSHEYLIKKSSEYIGFEANQDEIIALQNEIAQLRTDLLEAQKQVIETQIGITLT